MLQNKKKTQKTRINDHTVKISSPFIEKLLMGILVPWRGAENSTSGSRKTVPSACMTAVAVVYGRLTRFFPCSSCITPTIKWVRRQNFASADGSFVSLVAHLVDIQGNYVSAHLRLWCHHGCFLHLIPVGSQVGQPEVVINKLKTGRNKLLHVHTKYNKSLHKSDCSVTPSMSTSRKQ